MARPSSKQKALATKAEQQEAPVELIEVILEDTQSELLSEEQNAVNELTEVVEEVVEDVVENIATTDVKQEDDNVPNVSTHTPQDGCFIVGKKDKLIPCTNITLRNVRMADITEEILYLAHLGAELDVTFAPQLARVPYIVKMKLPVDSLELYNNRQEKPIYEESQIYLKVQVSASDRFSWIKKIIELGKKGAVLQPKLRVTNSPNYAAHLFTKFPVEWTVVTKISPERLDFSEEELMEMPFSDVRIVAKWYNIEGTSRAALVPEILNAQLAKNKRIEASHGQQN